MRIVAMFESGLRTMNKSIKVNGRLFCTLNPRYTRFTISTIDRLALAPKFQLTQQGYPANYVPPTAPPQPPFAECIVVSQRVVFSARASFLKRALPDTTRSTPLAMISGSSSRVSEPSTARRMESRFPDALSNATTWAIRLSKAGLLSLLP